MLNTLSGVKKSIKAVRGFTLIELMIAVAIMGILAALALPNYREYVKKARRTDGQVALMQEAQSLQRCQASTRTYAGCALGSNTSPESYYTIALSNASANTYTLTATAVNQQESDSACSEMTLDHRSVRTPSPETSDCWTR